MSDIARLTIDFLDIEAAAISNVKAKLSVSEIEKTIELLLNCTGKVIVFGVGKSAIIAEKLAATMTSTGTGAISLHAADSLHGDLGLAETGDVAIAISNSGETEELIALIPHLKTRNIPIISIVGKVDSTLGRQSSAVLHSYIDREACPLNLAPTASTTVALAIGDSIAMTLMQVKGVSKEKFALNHPAGQLGKRLTLKVSDIMHTNVNDFAVGSADNIVEVIRRLTQSSLGAVCLIDQEGKLIGIITDGDIRRQLDQTSLVTLQDKTAIEICTQKPICIQVNMMAIEALQLMENRSSQISVLPVTDQENTCIGLVRIHDIFKSGL